MKIVIDFGAWWHALRRWWHPRFGAQRPSGCDECNAPLTADERHYYGSTCNRCEGVGMGKWGNS